MRNPVRGWRSARAHAKQAPALPTSNAGVTAMPTNLITQEPLRLGLGIIALAFYLWIIHSYKLAGGDIAVLGLIVGVFLRGGDIKLPPPLIVFGLFILWGAVTVSEAAVAAISTQALIDLAKLWVISFGIINVIRTPAELRFLTIVWLGVFALYPVRGALFNQFICRCTEYGRVAWNFAFSNPNDLAALSLVPLGAAAGLSAVERNKMFRYAGMTGVLVLALIVMLTQSRGAMVGLGIAVILLPLTSRRRGRDIILTALVLGGAAIVAPKDVWTRMAGLSNVSVSEGMAGVDPEGSAQSRWQIWQIAGGVVRDHPLTGIGIGMMPWTSSRIASSQGLAWEVSGARDTHSTYLRIASETGIPGLLLYLSMWGVLIANVKRAKREIKFIRPREHQFLTFIELAVYSFLAASLFGTYGSVSFTYLTVAFVWLASDILRRHPWYAAGSAVPAPATPMMPVTARGQRRRTV